MAKQIVCCLNCKDRYRIVDGAFIEDCHDHCAKYKQESEERKADKQKLIDEKASDFRYHKTSRNRNENRYSKLHLYEEKKGGGCK